MHFLGYFDLVTFLRIVIKLCMFIYAKQYFTMLWGGGGHMGQPVPLCPPAFFGMNRVWKLCL